MGFLVFDAGQRQPYTSPDADVVKQTQLVAATTVGDIMSYPVVTVHPDLCVSSARRAFEDHGFRHLPVRTISGQLAGMVSDRDVLAVEPVAPDRWIVHVMTEIVVAVTPDTPLHEVAVVMGRDGIGALPVIDGEDQLVGIVTSADLLRVLACELRTRA